MMKKQLFGTFAILSLLLALTVVAQAQSRSHVTARIPFAFQVGEKVLPAGDYSIKSLAQQGLLVQSADGKHSAVAQAQGSVQNKANAKASREKLVFRLYGDQYFLAQVWLVRGDTGRELNMTEAERQAAREFELAQQGAKPQLVEVAAR